jgi:hypothetical protein
VDYGGFVLEYRRTVQLQVGVCMLLALLACVATSFDDSLTIAFGFFFYYYYFILEVSVG